MEAVMLPHDSPPLSRPILARTTPSSSNLDPVLAEQTTFTSDMIALLDQHYLDGAQMDVVDTLEFSRAPNHFIVPNHTPPCPLLVKFRPFLSNTENERVPRKKTVLRLRSIPNDVPRVPIANAAPVIEAPPPLNETVEPDTTINKPVEKAAPRRKKRAREPPVEPPPPSIPRPPSMSRAAYRLLAHNRPTYRERVQYLNPVRNLDLTDEDRATIRVLYDTPSNHKVALDLVSRLRELPNVKVKIPKPVVVAIGNRPVSHVVVPTQRIRSLYLTCALATGAWRVPYQWAEDTINFSRAQATYLSPESDYPTCYRSKHRIFFGKTYSVWLENEEEQEQIIQLLISAGAVPAAPEEDADIIVLELTSIPLDTPYPAKYWTKDDFIELYSDITTPPERARSYRKNFEIYELD